MNPSLPKHFTASGFVLRADKKVLLIHHRKLGVWLYPGGHIEPTETPSQAVIREIFEETSIKAEILGGVDQALEDLDAGVHVLHTPYRILCELINSPNDMHYHVDLIYLCAAATTDCVINDEVHDARFFGKDEINGLTLFPNFRVMLERLFEDGDVWEMLRNRQNAVREIAAEPACL